jgi:nucleotide-binding universal stress UspA family protein
MTTQKPLVVVGVDGSKCAREALRVAIEETRYRGGRLYVVAAWSVPVMMYAGGYMAGIDPSTFERAAEVEAANAVEEVRRAAPEIEVHGDVSHDSPTAALVEASKGAELLVVGSRGLGGFERLLLGSVSQQVAQHAECPVLIVRSRA